MGPSAGVIPTLLGSIFRKPPDQFLFIKDKFTGEII
jgi:hypothetical protein